MNRLLFAFCLLFLVSCVSSKKYNLLNGHFQECEKTTQMLKEQGQALSAKNMEQQNKIEKQQKEIAQLSASVADLEFQLKSLKTGSSEEIARLMGQLKETQADLQAREEILGEAKAQLEQRSRRLQELEDVLKQKDDAVKQLKQKVIDALLGFNDKGLTIHEKNGKVYVSLDEQLLFKTGQWDVGTKGQQALSDLAGVLGQNSDINVMVEGHTDNVPMRGTGMVKDNWDLSVMRATAVSRILLQNKAIDPKRIVASGRGEFVPIDEADTPEARQKNRRTEIILAPRLDEIFRLLEIN